MLLLLPVAMLLERRQWWAVAIPLATWLPFDAVYPAAFAVAMLGPVVSARNSLYGTLSGRSVDVQ